MLPHPRVPRFLSRPLRFALGVAALVGDAIDMLRDLVTSAPPSWVSEARRMTDPAPCARGCCCEECLWAEKKNPLAANCRGGKA